LFDSLRHKLNKNARRFFDLRVDALSRVLPLGRRNEDKRYSLSARQEQEHYRDQPPTNAGKEWLQR
jgi:hypothetical protein